MENGKQIQYIETIRAAMKQYQDGAMEFCELVDRIACETDNQYQTPEYKESFEQIVDEIWPVNESDPF
jgi:hypothetical protein